MANKRIFFPVHQVGFAPDGTQTFTAVHGLQSAGMNTTFNLDYVFEIGQLALYDTVEQVPEVEVTLEKVLDGNPLIYHLATDGATSTTLSGRSTQKAIVALAVFPDTQDSASGTPLAEVQNSGMTVSNVAYAFGSDGQFTESVTLQGFSKVWKNVESLGSPAFSGAFPTNSDVPAAITGSGGVQNRPDFVWVPLSGSPTGVDTNGQSKGYCGILPTDIDGVSSSGTNNLQSDGTYKVPVQSIQISCDLNRESAFELGRLFPYTRYVNFPIEVRTDIEVLATKWDNVSMTEAGGNNGAAAGSNLKSQTIRVQSLDGTRIDLGTRNKLSGLSYGGGDARGGNVTLRYSYVTQNTMNVYHPTDPSALAFAYGA